MKSVLKVAAEWQTPMCGGGTDDGMQRAANKLRAWVIDFAVEYSS
jgi:hypothetical protein